ncbi:putative ABC transporter permease protein [Arthrobacter globiformis NBRC 12137]|jgi:peptide/nickel transport system permease protein|uniref:Putative ABC transporter permease protein n=1 Tax=Arthrobacter globiformis (strain ATCC 8010 / DSM 20124 / JCM 1332 / NBRC 12137 / NCIMB 8907 / NRRL B-2979 / 168) TaxID=1077972 RepID=H0QGL2_ARTG1|nr:ABC transporter permease [Arthrobacter globiformis]GAB11963.1 putative ABC transporter permease protein [Arthrobacter globiformis NBRC 12137]
MSHVTLTAAPETPGAPDTAAPETQAPDEAAVPRRPRISRLQPGLVLSWLVLGLVALWTIAPGFFTSHSATSGTARDKLLPPGDGHLLGTDELGRDLYSRIVHGSINSVTGALVAVAVGLVVGTLLGLVAGSLGGVTDAVMMRIVDVLLSIPGLLLSLSIIIILGFGTVNAAIAVGVGSVASFARLARAEVLRVRRSDFVEAAFGSGGTFVAVLRRHILPNSAGSVLALLALQFGAAILAISTLGFLGYGAPPPTPEWGLLIAEGRNYVATSWWLTTYPGLVVVAVVLSANRISHSIRKVQP